MTHLVVQAGRERVLLQQAYAGCHGQIGNATCFRKLVFTAGCSAALPAQELAHCLSPFPVQHSCSPNLFVQNVFVDTHDLRFPWVAFFASK